MRKGSGRDPKFKAACKKLTEIRLQLQKVGAAILRGEFASAYDEMDQIEAMEIELKSLLNELQLAEIKVLKKELPEIEKRKV